MSRHPTVRFFRPALTRCGGAVATVVSATSLVGAQVVPTPMDAGVVGYELSADTIGFGDRFELRIALEVPEGRTAYLPFLIVGDDTFEGLPAREPLVEPSADGVRAVDVRYPLVAYRVGLVAIPEVVAVFGPSSTDSAKAAVTFFDPSDGPPTTAIRTESVPPQEIWVRSVLLLDDIEGLAPRPADDVVGPSWHAPAILSALAFGSLLLGVLFVSGREWLDTRSRGGAAVIESVDRITAARQRAIEELDALLASDLAVSDVTAFYERTSAAVRSYVEHFDGAWGPAHTSTELMVRLEEVRAPAEVHALVDEMYVAEIVKFGRLRPRAVVAQAHGRGLRAWVACS